MFKVLVISLPHLRRAHQEMPNGLYHALQSNVSDNFELYKSVTSHETLILLEEHEFVAIIVIFMAVDDASLETLQNQLALFISNGGTIIFTTRCLGTGTIMAQTVFKTNLGLDWAFCGDQLVDYVLNENSELVLEKSLIAKLERTVSTEKQDVFGNIPESAKIYVTEDQTSLCSAAFLRHGTGFIGYIGYGEEGPTGQTLLVAMIDHAIDASTAWGRSMRPEHGIESSAWSNTKLVTPDTAIQPSSAPASTYFQSPQELPALLDTNAGCVVCRIMAPAKKCSKCHGAQYCSTTCQKADWPSHKETCTSHEETPSIGDWSRTSTPATSEW